jgi:hypothetical protein
MSNIVFLVPLTCAACNSPNDERAGELYTHGMGNEAGHTFSNPGKLLDLEVVDFEDFYFTLRHPQDDAVVIALEIWECHNCHRVQFARLRFERVDATHWQFAGGCAVPASGSNLDEANFISRKIEEWAPSPGDDIDRMRDIVRRFVGSAGPSPSDTRSSDQPPGNTAASRRDLLESWTHSARPLADLCHDVANVSPMRDPDVLASLAIEAARSVLVNPAQNLGDISAWVEPLTAAAAPVARLAVLDLVRKCGVSWRSWRSLVPRWRCVCESPLLRSWMESSRSQRTLRRRFQVSFLVA